MTGCEGEVGVHGEDGAGDVVSVDEVDVLLVLILPLYESHLYCKTY